MPWNGLQCYVPLQISVVLTVCIFKRAEFATHMGTGSIFQDLVKNWKMYSFHGKKNPNFPNPV